MDEINDPLRGLAGVAALENGGDAADRDQISTVAQAVRDALIGQRQEYTAALEAHAAWQRQLQEEIANLRAQVVAFRRLVIEQRNELTREIGEVERRAHQQRQ